MNHLLPHFKALCATLLLVFLISGNVLLYSTHIVAEIGHHHQTATAYYGADELTHCSHDSGPTSTDGQQPHHEHKQNSCCESHSHVSIPHQSATAQFIPQVTPHPACEPFRFIPEVYLDKFIPPQNLA